MGEAATSTVSDRHAGIEPSGDGVYAYMDAARFVLAGIVAFAHAWHLLIADHDSHSASWAGLGYFVAGFSHASVIMFFVLSGYWIARSLESRFARGWSWRAYLSTRLSRLWLVLIPALVIGGALDIVGTFILKTPTHLGLTDTYVLRTNVAANLSWQTWLGNLVFLQEILVHPLGTNGPLWSLAWEWWFYLVYPALLLAWRSRRPHWSLLLLAVMVWHPILLLGFACWLLGVLVYALERRDAFPAFLYRPAAMSATLALWLVVLFYVRAFPFPGWELAVALAFAPFLATLLAQRPAYPRRFDAAARFGRQASFSLYLTHFPILAMIAGVAVGPARLVPSAGSLALVLLSFVFVVLYARGFAALTEGNTERLRAWLARRGAGGGAEIRKG